MKEGYTKKLYWGKWSHKVTLNLGSSNDEKPKTLAAVKKNSRALTTLVASHTEEYKTLKTYTYTELASNKRVYEWPYRSYAYMMDNFLTLYFKDVKVLTALLADPAIAPLITYVEKPYSEAHLDALEVERMVVRKTLWWERYRYAARLKPQPRDHSFPRKTCALEQDIRTWIKAQLIKASKRVEDVDYRFTSSGYYKTVMHIYFAHASDAMLFRLTFGQHVKHNERIKLMSELEETPSESQ